MTGASGWFGSLLLAAAAKASGSSVRPFPPKPATCDPPMRFDWAVESSTLSEPSRSLKEYGAGPQGTSYMEYRRQVAMRCDGEDFVIALQPENQIVSAPRTLARFGICVVSFDGRSPSTRPFRRMTGYGRRRVAAPDDPCALDYLSAERFTKQPIALPEVSFEPGEDHTCGSSCD
jgi:hypothetical protein